MSRRHHHRSSSLRASRLPTEASYVCESCGERIVIPIDATEGHHQEYVEDCPVCCHSNVIRLDIRDDGSTNADSLSEDDLYE